MFRIFVCVLLFNVFLFSQDSKIKSTLTQNAGQNAKNIESSLQDSKNSQEHIESKRQDSINHNTQDFQYKNIESSLRNAKDSIKLAKNEKSKAIQDSKNSQEHIESKHQDFKTTTQNIESKTTQDSKIDSKDSTESKPKKQKKPKQSEPMFPLLNKEKKEELYHDGYLNATDIPAAPMPLNKLSKLPLEDWRDTYMIYLYNFTPMYDPKFWRNEAKIQISFRVPMVRNIFKSGGILYAALTDTFFFQLFNESASSPVRDNDFQPEILYTYPMNIQFWGGALTEITTGWRHISNGEVGERSRGSDRWTIKAIWQSKHWGVDVESGFPVRYYEENPDIYKYIAGIDVKVYMRYGNHLADLTFSNFVRKKDLFKGSLRLSYTYKYSQYVGLYIQYFIGNNDYLYEYNSFGHRIGAGFRFIR